MKPALNLDMDFIRRAEKVTAFNLTAKDFETLEYKREIQYLFNKNFFPNFDLSKTIKGVDMRKLNNLISSLRSNDMQNFVKMHKYPLKGVGPGEATMFFLVDDGHLGGGSSAGVDFVVGSKKYEIKAVDVSSDGFAYNFKLGGTFPISDIVRDLQDLQKRAGYGSGAEVNKGTIAKIRANFPAELKDIESRFVDRSYENYFKNHDIIFIRNTTNKIGDIVAVKKIKKEEIFLERITSGVAKPTVKI